MNSQEEEIVQLDNDISIQAKLAYRTVVALGYYWNLAGTQENTYAGIRTYPLSNTILCRSRGPNELSEVILETYEDLREYLNMAEILP